MNDESLASKRKKFLIYPKFQLALILFNTLLMSFITGLLAIQVNRSLEAIRKIGTDAAIPPEHPYYKFLEWQAAQINSYLTVALVVGSVISMLVTLVISHRLAGPFVRLKIFFKQIADRGWGGEKITFRKNDFFSDLPSDINQALDRIQKDESIKKAA